MHYKEIAQFSPYRRAEKEVKKKERGAEGWKNAKESKMGNDKENIQLAQLS